MTETKGDATDVRTEIGAEATRVLSPEAKRALAEAEERRRQATAAQEVPVERGGRAGPDPVRYGDWENGGIASDF
jgi:hypothetical protein